jgi:Cytochrome c554 and c-prime
MSGIGPYAVLLLLLSFPSTESTLLAQEGFVGANTCGHCHPAHFAKQSRSNHAKALRPASELSSLDWVLEGTGVESNDPQAARYHFKKRGLEYVVEVALADNQLKIPVQWIFGANDQGLTFFSRFSEGRFLEHRLSYYKRKEGFDTTAGHPFGTSRTLEQAIGLVVSAEDAFKCLHCHSTYVKQTPSGPDFSSVIPGVTCERCHGPGADHVAAVRAGAADRRIRNPGKLPGDELMWMCGECHRNEPPIGKRFDEPIVTRFQPVGLQLSSCFQESNGGITCTSCHNPHENVRRSDDGFYNARCLRCHAEQSNTRCRVRPSEGCISCHMPKTNPLPHLTFSDHWIRIPRRTAAAAK